MKQPPAHFISCFTFLSNKHLPAQRTKCGMQIKPEINSVLLHCISRKQITFSIAFVRCILPTMLTAIFLLLILPKVLTDVWAFQLHVAQILNAFCKSHLHGYNWGLCHKYHFQGFHPSARAAGHRLSAAKGHSFPHYTEAKRWPPLLPPSYPDFCRRAPAAEQAAAPQRDARSLPAEGHAFRLPRPTSLLRLKALEASCCISDTEKPG